MALNSTVYATVSAPGREYQGVATEVDPVELGEFIRSLLERIQQLEDLAPQAADVAPKNPRIGMIRWAVAPWNPGSGDGLYRYNGTSWVLV